MEPTSQEVRGGARPSSGQQALQALRRIGDSDLREIVDLVRSICGVEAAAITILDGATYHLLVVAGSEPLATAAHRSICEHTMRCPSTVVVEDAAGDNLGFYASAPIVGPDAVMVGRLCLFDRGPRRLSPLQERTLSTLATNVTKVIELRMLQQEEQHEREAESQPPPTTEEAVRVAAQISHDMRVPLTALTTSLDMLGGVSPSEQDELRARLYATARRSADRINHMIEGLLRLNDAGRDPERCDVDLDQLARQVASDMESQLGEAQASLAIGPLPVVQADPDQLYSVLLNLVTNALKFARPGVAPVIRIEGHRVDAGWRICVIDNGRGIPADRRDDVFAMFARLDTAVEGHGIGLATVRRIVEGHGGRVGAGHATEQGAHLWFELPDASDLRWP